MKKIKFMAMLLMATMALGFTACSDDDEDAPSIEDINGKLEGDWFLVKVSGWVEEDGEKYSETVTWDYENRGEVSSEGGYNPCWLYVRATGEENTFRFSSNNSRYYYCEWNNWIEDIQDENPICLENNVIDDWINESSDDVDGYGCYKITKLNDSELVIVAEETDYDYACSVTYTYKRVDE